MAETALTIADEPSLTAQLAIAAAERCPGLLFIPNEIATLEYERRGLAYMNCWFFAFAHELGHFQPVELTETWRDFARSKLIDYIGGMRAVPKSLRDEIIAKIQTGRTGPLLDTDQIVTEALADASAMIILFESALPVMKKAGQLEQFSIEGFYFEAILSLNIVATFAQIEQVILARRHGIAHRETILEQGFYKGVIGARGNVAFAIFQLYLQGKYPNAKVFSLNLQVESLAKTTQHFEQEIVAWDRGVGAAMKTLFSLQLPCDVSHFLDRLNALPEGTFELHHLSYLAKAAGKSSWYIRALERKLADPRAKIDVEDVEIGGEGCLFLVATVEQAGQYPLPVCLQVGEDLVCFVFYTQEIFHDFLALLTRMLGDTAKVTSTLLVTRGEEGVHDQIGMWLRPHVRAEVLIQGSEAFDRHYLRLLDQTAEIGKIGMFLPQGSSRR